MPESRLPLFRCLGAPHGWWLLYWTEQRVTILSIKASPQTALG